MHEGHAADGRRDREVVCDADLRKIVRSSQIYATYVWTRPGTGSVGRSRPASRSGSALAVWPVRTARCMARACAGGASATAVYRALYLKRLNGRAAADHEINREPNITTMLF